MRTFVGVAVATTVLFVGTIALSFNAQNVQSNVSTTSENEAFDLVTEVFSGVITTGGDGIVWFGVGAVILIACGILVSASGGR